MDSEITWETPPQGRDAPVSRPGSRAARKLLCMATRPQTVRLTSASYDLLAQEARRRGKEPDALANELLQADLGAGAVEDLDETLAELAQFRAGLSEIDGVALAGEARRELEARSA